MNPTTGRRRQVTVLLTTPASTHLPVVSPPTVTRPQVEVDGLSVYSRVRYLPRDASFGVSCRRPLSAPAPQAITCGAVFTTPHPKPNRRN